MSKKQKKVRYAPKLKIKKGDRVIIIRGDDKGKQGEILQVFPKKQRVIVEQLNMVRKHQKPTQDNTGGIIDMPAPLPISNVQLIDPKTGEPCRVGRKLVDGKLVRYSKKSGEIIK